MPCKARSVERPMSFAGMGLQRSSPPRTREIQSVPLPSRWRVPPPQRRERSGRSTCGAPPASPKRISRSPSGRAVKKGAMPASETFSTLAIRCRHALLRRTSHTRRADRSLSGDEKRTRRSYRPPAARQLLNATRIAAGRDPTKARRVLPAFLPLIFRLSSHHFDLASREIRHTSPPATDASLPLFDAPPPAYRASTPPQETPDQGARQNRDARAMGGFQRFPGHCRGMEAVHAMHLSRTSSLTFPNGSAIRTPV